MLFWIVSNDEVKNPLNGLLNFSKRHFIRKKKSSVEFGMISKRVEVVIKMCTKLKPLWWYPCNNEWSFRFTPFFLSFKWTYLPIVTRLFSCYFFRTNSSSSPVPFVCFEDFLTPLSIYRMVSLFNLEECQDVENISFFVFPVAMIFKINVFLELLSHCLLSLLIGGCEDLIMKKIWPNCSVERMRCNVCGVSLKDADFRVRNRLTHLKTVG